MSSKERTHAATSARLQKLSRMTKEQRRAIGLRLFAIYSGRQTQKAYRARGIFDPLVKARAVRAQKAFERKMLGLDKDGKQKT